MNHLRDDLLRADLAELAEAAKPADLHDRVLAASRRARARRIAGAALAVVLLAGAGVAAVVWRGPSGNALPPASPTATATLPEGELAIYDPTISKYDAGPLAHATFAVPPWPGQPQCPSGTLSFIKDGLANAPSQATVHIIAVTPGDVDGDGSTEQVAILECYPETGPTEPLFHYQVLAVTDPDSTGAARTMGRITATGTGGIVGVFALEVTPDGTVRVKVGDGVAATAPTAQLQWREYRWQGTQFAQTGGETSFPANPPAVDLGVTATASATTVDGQRYVTITVSATNTGALAPLAAPLVTILVPTNLVPVDPARWTGCVRNLDGVAEGQLGLQCPFPIGLGSVDYTFRQQGGPGNVTTVYIAIDQATPRAVERNLANNLTEFPVP